MSLIDAIKIPREPLLAALGGGECRVCVREREDASAQNSEKEAAWEMLVDFLLEIVQVGGVVSEG